MTHPKIPEVLLNPAFYPERPQAVELLQTHVSYIFLAGDYVYKVKKDVDFGFLDFTSLEKRKWYCQEELRLNRRLARETYLEVVAISEDEQGRLFIGAGDKIVEYAVKMRRLDQGRMLKVLLKEGIDPSIMDRLAVRIADFHQEAATGGQIDLIGGPDTVRHNHEENFLQTESYIDITIPKRQFEFIKNYCFYFLNKHAGLFQARVREQRIRECHGDLHLEHICLTNGITIFDCIEFNERFRFADVAAEVAFLAMDLDYNGYQQLAERFVRAYADYTEDRELLTLINFYKCYYAYVRGKVVSFKLDDRAIGLLERDEAKKTARRYFDLAMSYAARLIKPALVLTAGLMGSGKSVFASSLAPLLGAELLRSDVERKRLLHLEAASRHHDPYGQGIYTDAITDKTYDELLKRAGELIREGKTVIIDASYKKRKHRLSALALAGELGAGFFLIEVTCPEDIIKSRLNQREQEQSGEPSDGRAELLAPQKRDFEEILEIPAGHHLAVDTSGQAEEYLTEALMAIMVIHERTL